MYWGTLVGPVAETSFWPNLAMSGNNRFSAFFSSESDDLLRRYRHLNFPRRRPSLHLGFGLTENSANRSTVPENPTIKPKTKWIGWSVAEIWPGSWNGSHLGRHLEFWKCHPTDSWTTWYRLLKNAENRLLPDIARFGSSATGLHLLHVHLQRINANISITIRRNNTAMTCLVQWITETEGRSAYVPHSALRTRPTSSQQHRRLTISDRLTTT